jgi:membrane-associated phospholipid phosphatase
MGDQEQNTQNKDSFVPLVPTNLNQYVAQFYEKLHSIDIFYSNKIYSFTQQYTLLRIFSKVFAKLSDTIALPFFFLYYWSVEGESPALFALWVISCLLVQENIIKKYFHRKRPVTAGKQKGLSFPSSHAFVSGMVIAAILLFQLPFGAFLISIAVINILNRPAIGVHYLADIIAGAFLGALAGLLWSVILSLLPF